MLKKYNELLSLLLLIVIIPGLWVAEGLDKIQTPEAVIGATIMAWGLILQYYFRKKPPTGGP